MLCAAKRYSEHSDAEGVASEVGGSEREGVRAREREWIGFVFYWTIESAPKRPGATL